jgi:esterase/lipase superfamily enzyme
MEMLVFGHAGTPLILFPTSKGRYYENKDFKLIESAAWFIENGMVRIYCPDSLDEAGWYNTSIHPADRVKTHMAYDHLIREEVIPRAIHETGIGRIAVAGCSFGGYHAANIAFRYPELVACLISMGGAFDINMHLDGYHDDNVYYHNPTEFLVHLAHPDLWRMAIILGTGEYDFCKPENERLSGILHGKGINHWLDIRPGANHDWPVWREMFPHYMSVMH